MIYTRLIKIAVAIAILAGAIGNAAAADPAPRPNILWITCEDISANLRCYGDEYAVTPHLDRLASEGVRYTEAFAPIGVCAPARSCLITGMWPPSLGTQHMRCQGILPHGVKCFPEHLRQAGYYCTNNVKTDYNFKAPAETWDESSNRADWRGRAAGQPFFSVINLTASHEGQIRLPKERFDERTKGLSAEARHDPAKAVVPPYHPDVPEVRRDWAHYADLISVMDGQMGEILDRLEHDGLADETIVFFFSDHGAGLPRSKRWLYQTSTHVPLIVRFPEKYRAWAPGKPGSTCDRLVSFVDFAPTVLSLAGVEIPNTMQGTAFLGPAEGPQREYVNGYRDRMDERYDLLRSVYDGRFRLIRNYMPHQPYFHEQHISYMYEMPTMQAWQRLADDGQLTGAAALWMHRQKPPIELYDTKADPWEVKNLAGDDAYAEVRERLHTELQQWMRESRDLGFLPEPDLRVRFGSKSPYDAVRESPESYPLDRALAAAELAASAGARSADDRQQLLQYAADSDAAVRYWGVLGLTAGEEVAAEKSGRLDSGVETVLQTALADSAPAVRIVAAECVARHEDGPRSIDVLVEALESDNEWTSLMAANAIDRLDDRAAAARPAIERLAPKSQNKYAGRVMAHILGEKPPR